MTREWLAIVELQKKRKQDIERIEKLENRIAVLESKIKTAVKRDKTE
jgi:CII-binding regulator of phage lambda lysogenization HflD